jgi:uncharacterized phage infection (PIP) family protein YhgE
MSSYRDVIQKARKTQNQQAGKSDKKRAAAPQRQNTTITAVNDGHTVTSAQSEGLFQGLQDVAEQLQGVVDQLQGVLDQIQGGEDGSRGYNGSLLEGFQDITGQLQSVANQLPDILNQIQGVLDGQSSVGGQLQGDTESLQGRQGEQQPARISPEIIEQLRIIIEHLQRRQQGQVESS